MFSGELKEHYSFEALHFSYYNRHCTRGHDVPEDAHPNQIARVDNSRTNYAQMLPYMSLDTCKHESVYHNMGNIFRGVFEWIDNQIQGVLPEEYHNLSLHANSLPKNVHTIGYPFLSVVVNLNAATLAHRDRKDKGLCVVIAIGNFENGELCLYEPGLVVPLCSGDIIVFPSARITH
ncbi:hypothetical protein FOMPIDRAFT_1123574 [Fomitopsis schrenkii]|uniref:Uncharacterized protein n=1 Tax=Fomitopsis schrenkii TaxID=2126942 RepID=S8E3Y9_FOMSC|nr:hypothetical protein FOMPIDRAFT_1123574 [Fomitopsis schrenkii]